MRASPIISPFSVVAAVFLLFFAAGALGAVPGTAPGAEPARAGDLARSSRAAGIEVRVTPLPPAAGGSAGEPQRLRFQVTMDAHAGNLVQYDLTRIAVLRTGGGTSVESGFVWEPQSESSHHRSGILWAPGRVDGEPLLDGSGGVVELELKGLAVASRIFRWTPEELVSAGDGQRR